MAKMTVWNRMVASNHLAVPVKSQQPAKTFLPSSSNAPRQTGSAPIFKLAHPVLKEPEFSIRRILQMAHRV